MMRHIECDAFWLLSHFLMPFTSNFVIGLCALCCVRECESDILKKCSSDIFWLGFLFSSARVHSHIPCGLLVWFWSLYLSVSLFSSSFVVLLMGSLNLKFSYKTFMYFHPSLSHRIHCHCSTLIYRHFYRTIRRLLLKTIVSAKFHGNCVICATHYIAVVSVYFCNIMK